MQPADISELSDGVPGPFLTDPHRRGTVPTLCPLWGQDSPPHGSGTGDPAALDGSLFRRQRDRREPIEICGYPTNGSQIPYYNRATLGFPEIDPVGVCPSGCRCAVAWDFAA